MRRWPWFLLLTVSVQTLVWPQASTTSSSSPTPVVGCSCKRTQPSHKSHVPPPPPTINVNIELENPTATPDKQPPCDLAKEKASLADARNEFDDGNFDKARTSYGQLLQSCDPKTKDAASDGFALSRQKLNTWWWQAGQFIPPIRWPFLYPFLCLALIVLLVAFSTRLLPRGGVLFWCRRVVQSAFMTGFSGQATIIAPTDLGKEAQVALFAAALESNAKLARELMSGDREHFQVRSTNLLSVPSELASSTFKDLPEVEGVKLAGIAQFLLSAGRYFSWRVETQLAFFPSSGDESARMLAISTLRWAWFSDTPIRLDYEVRDAQDVDALAFAVAARILGRYFVPEN